MEYILSRGFDSPIYPHALVVELVDTLDLGSSNECCAGSNPVRSTS